MRRVILGSAVLLLVAGGLLGVASGQGTKGPLPFVDSDGTIHFPGRVWDEWSHFVTKF